MSFIRRIRGLVGTALTWGIIGAVASIPVFVVVMRAWNAFPDYIGRAFRLFATWEGIAFMWGGACGLAFGITLLLLERKRPLHQLSPARVAAWGALAGALFPTAVTLRLLLRGADPLYFGGIILASALTGAVWARLSVAIAKRAPESEPEPLISQATV